MNGSVPNGTTKAFAAVSRFFFGGRKKDKVILPMGALSVDMCTGVLTVHDGKTCGGRFHYYPGTVCEQTVDAPVLGLIEGVDVAEDLCDLMATAPNIGNI